MRRRGCKTDSTVDPPSTIDGQSDVGRDSDRGQRRRYTSSTITRTRRSSWQLYTGQQQPHPRPLTSSRLDTTVNKQGGASTTDGQTNVDADNGDSCTVDRDSGIQRPQTSMPHHLTVHAAPRATDPELSARDDDDQETSTMEQQHRKGADATTARRRAAGRSSVVLGRHAEYQGPQGGVEESRRRHGHSVVGRGSRQRHHEESGAVGATVGVSQLGQHHDTSHAAAQRPNPRLAGARVTSKPLVSITGPS
jgi:hypothetical protein